MNTGELSEELARLEGTRFFANKPRNVPQSKWLYKAALREFGRFGQYDNLGYHYARLSAFARMQEGQK